VLPYRLPVGHEPPKQGGVFWMAGGGFNNRGPIAALVLKPGQGLICGQRYQAPGCCKKSYDFLQGGPRLQGQGAPQSGLPSAAR
jgi:hypothetical protein